MRGAAAVAIQSRPPSALQPSASLVYLIFLCCNYVAILPMGHTSKYSNSPVSLIFWTFVTHDMQMRSMTPSMNSRALFFTHGLNMSTGHYTVLVRHKCASDHIWGLHLNDAKVPEPVTHSVMSDITSRDGRRIDLEKGNLVYSGKPYLLLYVRKHHRRAQPAMAFLTGALISIENLCVSLTIFDR